MATAEVSWTNLETGTIQTYDFEFHIISWTSIPTPQGFLWTEVWKLWLHPWSAREPQRGIARLQYIEEELAYYFNLPHACSGGIQAFCDNTLERCSDICIWSVHTCALRVLNPSEKKPYNAMISVEVLGFVWPTSMAQGFISSTISCCSEVRDQWLPCNAARGAGSDSFGMPSCKRWQQICLGWLWTSLKILEHDLKVSDANSMLMRYETIRLDQLIRFLPDPPTKARELLGSSWSWP